MEHPVGSNRLKRLPIVAFTFMVLLAACSDEKHSTMSDVDPETFPTMKTVDVSTLVSDSGYTRYHITADTWLMFDEAREPHWTFPEGIFMERYNDLLEVESTFEADSATYLSQRRKWQFDGNVRMVNTAGDKFLTEQLFWDQQEAKVYSDSFIHIERIDRTLEGYGFVSNEQMTEYTILNVSGIFPAPQKQEENSPNDSASAVMPSTAEASRERRAKAAAKNEEEVDTPFVFTSPDQLPPPEELAKRRMSNKNKNRNKK